MSLSRGRYPARLTLPDIPDEVLERYRLHWRGEALHTAPQQFAPLTAAQLFGGHAGPLAVDIGCATGEFVCGLAELHPERRLLGIEMSRKPIEHAVLRASGLGLENIRFLQADVTMVGPLLVPESVGTFYIHFPVPYTTTHKRKHHTYGPRMLGHYLRALVPGGRISIVTDSPDVRQDVQAMMADEPRLREIDQGGWQLSLDEHLKSPYQRLWEKRGRAIWRAEYEKQG